MKNIFTHAKPRRSKHHSEIVEVEISDWQSQISLPRHISAPETKSHRGGRNLDKTSYVPRMCHVEVGTQNNANLAVDILKYQLSDRASQQKHLENLRHNLTHRLQVAKTQGNSQLLHILQDEYKQLEKSGT